MYHWILQNIKMHFIILHVIYKEFRLIQLVLCLKIDSVK